ncbi:hypothetical protein OKW48_008202 [Paraburkholderia youngii]
MFVVPTLMPTTYSVRCDTSVACATTGLPSVRLRAGSTSGTRIDLPTATDTLDSSRISPVQFGPVSCAGATIRPLVAPLGIGVLLTSIGTAPRPTGSGAACTPQPGGICAAAIVCAALSCVAVSPAHSAAASTVPPSERQCLPPPDEYRCCVFMLLPPSLDR